MAPYRLAVASPVAPERRFGPGRRRPASRRSETVSLNWRGFFRTRAASAPASASSSVSVTATARGGGSDVAGGAQFLADLPVLRRGRRVPEIFSDAAQRPQTARRGGLALRELSELELVEALTHLRLLALGQRVEQDEHSVSRTSYLVHPETIAQSTPSTGRQESSTTTGVSGPQPEGPRSLVYGSGVLEDPSLRGVSRPRLGGECRDDIARSRGHQSAAS